MSYEAPDFRPSIFRQYDIRGVAERDLHDAFVRALGRAFATWIGREAGPGRIVVGRDCRLSGPRLQAAFIDGVRGAGVDVIDVGVVPTPLVYYSLFELPEIAGGVCITGSHNPAPDNGFKLCAGTRSMFGDQILALRDLIASGDLASGEGGLETLDVLTPYHEHLVGNLRRGRRLRVVVDGGNGTGGHVAVPIYRALGYEVVELYTEMDGRFPNHHPDPTVEANLAELAERVAERGADLGIAFDGDADRIGAVDGQGRVVWGDQLLAFFARAVLAEHPGARIVSEVKCSRTLYDDIAAHGGQAEMWKVGHSLIKARMRETGALLAGEMSGHIFFKHRYFGFDDAIYAGGRLLELISLGEASLATLLDGLPPTTTTPELRVRCPDEVKFEVVARAVAHFKSRYPVFDLDGARIDFPAGWGLIRPSNTQPVLVMRFEADSQANLDAYRGEVEAWLRAFAPEADLETPPGH